MRGESANLASLLSYKKLRGRNFKGGYLSQTSTPCGQTHLYPLAMLLMPLVAIYALFGGAISLRRTLILGWEADRHLERFWFRLVLLHLTEIPQFPAPFPPC